MVEHSLGKGEVGSSILLNGSIDWFNWLVNARLAANRTGLTNLNIPISEFSAILIGPMGQEVERKWQETVKVFTMRVMI